MKRTYRFTLLLMLLVVAAFTVGCSGEKADIEKDEESTTEDSSDEHFPVTIDNANRELTFDKAPERVIGLYQQEAELFAALDLEDKLVGFSMVSDSTPEDLKEKLADVPVLAENGYPSKEVLLEKDPDFIVGSERTFTDNGAGTIEEFDELDIAAYVSESEKPETIENMVYKQVEETAEIFGVEERGEKLIESMQADMDEITEKVKDVDEPVKVLLMSAGESGSAQVSGGASLDSHLIELAGGENVFADENEYLLEASWEEIIDRNPDVIVTSFCCGTKPEDLEKIISENSSMQDVTAVKEGNYVAVPVEDTTGNVRVVQGLERLAESFYPELFE